MKKRFLLVVALCILVPVVAYSVGEGIREWVWGLGHYIGVDVTVDGDVTADSFVSGPSLNAGGSIVLSECEGGTNCPAAAAGNSLTIKLPDNANPLAGNKVYNPGFQMMGYINETGFNSEEDGNLCLMPEPTGDVPGVDALACTTSHLEVGHPFMGGGFVDHCLISVASVGGWTTGDDLWLQIVALTEAGAKTTVGMPFRITNTADAGCGAMANCTLAVGTFLWQVSVAAEDCAAANDPYDCCTGAGAGATCDDGASTPGTGFFAIEILAASDDVEADAQARLQVRCNYF